MVLCRTIHYDFHHLCAYARYKISHCLTMACMGRCCVLDFCQNLVCNLLRAHSHRIYGRKTLFYLILPIRWVLVSIWMTNICDLHYPHACILLLLRIDKNSHFYWSYSYAVELLCSGYPFIRTSYSSIIILWGSISLNREILYFPRKERSRI